MNLKITTTIATSTGLMVSNAIGLLVQHSYMDVDGNLIVPSDIKWYKSISDMNNGLDTIIPCLFNNNGTINKRISSCNVTLTPSQAAAAGLPYTMYTASAAQLASDTGWTVVVEI